MDYTNVLQIHRFDPKVTIENTMKALHDVVETGHVRYIGASRKNLRVESTPSSLNYLSFTLPLCTLLAPDVLPHNISQLTFQTPCFVVSPFL
jgi:aryl-alcohol dehydrogenase-like predicted oxidoreductase